LLEADARLGEALEGAARTHDIVLQRASAGERTDTKKGRPRISDATDPIERIRGMTLGSLEVAAHRGDSQQHCARNRHLALELEHPVQLAHRLDRLQYLVEASHPGQRQTRPDQTLLLAQEVVRFPGMDQTGLPGGERLLDAQALKQRQA
jgi:hypothetical protein